MFQDHLYHVYNRGINKQRVFFTPDHYDLFLYKVNKYICPVSDLIGYCLMPNHFHLLIRIRKDSIEPYREDIISQHTRTSFGNQSRISRGLQQTLSTYTKAINQERDRVGSLFCQNTRKKSTGDGSMGSYSAWCLHYLHNNPVGSGLVGRPEEWDYSSYNEYFGQTERSICKHAIGRRLLHFELTEF